MRQVQSVRNIFPHSLLLLQSPKRQSSADNKYPLQVDRPVKNKNKKKQNKSNSVTIRMSF